MASNRIGRINEEIQRELSDLIRSLKDPRVQTLISITRVDTTPDLRYSKIYISVMAVSYTHLEENQRSIRMLAGSIAPRPCDTPASMPAR